MKVSGTHLPARVLLLQGDPGRCSVSFIIFAAHPSASADDFLGSKNTNPNRPKKV